MDSDTPTSLFFDNDRTLQVENFHFSIIDYCVFASMLLLSAGSGCYYGYYRNSENTGRGGTAAPTDDENKNEKLDFGSKSMNEYLLGSRKMKAFPVAMSLVASYISGVTMLGTPSEIYNYGTQYWFIIIPIVLMGITVSTVFIPVFSSLGVGSSYEYLELRFNNKLRTIASVMFVIDEILFLPIVIYVPSLAFNQVTGINLYLVGLMVCIVCLFYTILGGLRAVVFTDAWQITVMFISVVCISVLGTYYMGGFGEVFRLAIEGGRIKLFDMDTSLYKRQTIYGVIFGGYLYWTSFNAVNQTMVQRYMSLPNLKTAKVATMIYTIGICLFVSVCCYCGLLVYAAYIHCDPMTAGLIKADDQLLPLYVMQTVGHLKGMPGLFIAGVFGAALSSLSVILNSTSAVLYEDILKGVFKINPSERNSSLFVKGSILIMGALAMACLFVVEKLGGILGVATALSAIAAGTTFGVFFLGMLVPWANSKGALIGAICGAFMSGWVSIGSQAMVAAGRLASQRLDVAIDQCPAELGNITSTIPPLIDESDVFPLYRLSFHWINPIGVFTVVIIGTIVSFLTGARDLKTIDPELISPVIHRFLPKECFTNFGHSVKAKKSYGTCSEPLHEINIGCIASNNSQTCLPNQKTRTDSECQIVNQTDR